MATWLEEANWFLYLFPQLLVQSRRFTHSHSPQLWAPTSTIDCPSRTPSCTVEWCWKGCDAQIWESWESSNDSLNDSPFERLSVPSGNQLIKEHTYANVLCRLYIFFWHDIYFLHTYEYAIYNIAIQPLSSPLMDLESIESPHWKVQCEWFFMVELSPTDLPTSFNRAWLGPTTDVGSCGWAQRPNLQPSSSCRKHRRTRWRSKRSLSWPSATPKSLWWTRSCKLVTWIFLDWDRPISQAPCFMGSTGWISRLRWLTIHGPKYVISSPTKPWIKQHLAFLFFEKHIDGNSLFLVTEISYVGTAMAQRKWMKTAGALPSIHSRWALQFAGSQFLRIRYRTTKEGTPTHHWFLGPRTTAVHRCPQQLFWACEDLERSARGARPKPIPASAGIVRTKWRLSSFNILQAACSIFSHPGKSHPPNITHPLNGPNYVEVPWSSLLNHCF